ncbi:MULTISPECIES: serine--tRNA ligase [Pseudothermotoga]|jgi:seryl-tRNA synthetase|uniref:Serine--tRNA ligase n=1 Tax=Pseudothermotoga lettingae (strain ATCC BAA-301 / DSM 14385 / NBRC 107922 / TMO) TaxID=416591 RepID=SYS_PSELT|nr:MULTISPECIES: serine--tRNA ligase [Pseudothermotoga]A8F3R6.1 RecName: Full=Serine--tRNA ligase; AltName: Full=Seryl-tRNA synthetase; Short=SerRS; AltName: Full=Seryl-tRNA(Ser/Sec) synthetase [Pseudothermotoga lettingae TMO]ABV32800.1 seryl-tRNA synthetase [Pseudothermotoga lettingae TMO]KUK21527.1 MAG: Serine--tRNA ligase [Pseudothermotoga lettingae]MDI3495145.1 seryl-tRNA synthetase [Pseudothermotoga sp.]MDK2885189.1 seryl-tRNA synthetase [Pseudothermotoga sp.]GLI48204.1 serine--tRNA liga
MIDIRLIREKPDFVKKALEKRNYEKKMVDDLLSLDAQFRELTNQINQLRAQRNSISKMVAQAKSSGKTEEIENLTEEGKKIGRQIDSIEDQLKEIKVQMEKLMLLVPNIPDDSVPEGKDETSNREIRKWGDPKKFDYNPQAHWDLGPSLGLMDFDRAAKLSGSRFTVMYGMFAKLERALTNFMLDMHTKEHGYTEVWLPHIVKRETMTITGQLPKFEEEAYRIEADDLFLIPTAEVPLVALRSNEILEEKDLPLLYTAYTPCYRREAGSYGKDVRGMIRQHQFDKVELVWITTPERSFEDLETLVSHAEEVLRRLELPYRVIQLCSGDLGFGAAKTYDLEVWLPSYNSYKEISSCSNDTDFQARRGNIRYRRKDGKISFVHTLNGSGVAVGRTLVAIIENYQRADGRIDVPKALQPYLGCEVLG